MKIAVKKWGNSASVRIPKSVVQAARLKIDQAVDIREEDGRVVIEPVRERGHDLAALIGAIEPANRHDEADFGAPMGREAL